MNREDFMRVLNEYREKVGLRGHIFFLDWDKKRKRIFKNKDKSQPYSLLDAFLPNTTIIYSCHVPQEAIDEIKQKQQLFIKNLK